jgi:hemerythrin-like domain-containing protein
MNIGDAPSAGFDNPLGLLSDCHRRIERFLHALTVVAATPDPLDARHREALLKSLDYFRESGPRHTEDEEASLFPRLRPHRPDLLPELEHDHDEADRVHGEIDALGRRWLEEGVLGAADREALQAALRALTDLYGRHIREEDEVVFPAAAACLRADEFQAVGYEMAARRGLSPRPPWERD